jgi:AcrR family transcriptional regulator
MLPLPTLPTSLLDTALTCFVQRGLHATSTDYLVQATGLSKGKFYSLIGSKDQLLTAVYAHAIGQLQAPLLSATSPGKDYERVQELLLRWWQLTATAAQTHPHAFAFWRLFRTSRFAFGTGEPLLGPFEPLPAAIAARLAARSVWDLPTNKVSVNLLVTLFTAQWTAIVEVVLTDAECQVKEALRTQLLQHGFEDWWRGLARW